MVALHDGRYGPAVAHLQRAVAAWPKAVTAYADLGQAQFLNEGELSGVTSVPKKSSLEEAIADDSKAIENGSSLPWSRRTRAAACSSWGCSCSTTARAGKRAR